MSPPRSRFVFVAGLHRTGTSLLARIIAAHPAISAIENAPVPESEGCYLQGAIPHTALDGRPGHYATDPLQHHTEQSPWNTLETQRRLYDLGIFSRVDVSLQNPGSSEPYKNILLQLRFLKP